MSEPGPITDRPGGDEPGGSPFTRPGFLVSAGVVLVIVVLAGFLVFTGGEDDDRPSAAPTSSSATSSTGSSPQTGAIDGEACDLPAGDQTVPAAAPDTDWTLVGTVAAPSSDQAGPAITDPTTGVRSCYAQTPTGALFAAANFLAAITDRDSLVPAVEQLTAEGSGRDILLEQVRTDPASAIGTGTRYQIAGYSFLSARQDVVTVSLAIGTTGGMAGIPLTVVREDGDWKISVPADGNVSGQASPIANLSGYVPWAGA